MLFNIERPTGLMLKQIKEYKTELDYNYAAMTYTLWYIKEITNKQFEEKYGIALIKYTYEEARRYFEQQQDIKNSIDNSEIKTKIIKNNRKVTKSFNPLINLENIIKGGE
jgi:predicted adenine nucleotide alpha hydrolase (AANH) superfamily ATPase